MTSLFDDVARFVGQGRSADDLTAALPGLSREAAQQGIVLAAPVVIANLADRVQDADGVAWLEGELSALDPSGIDDFSDLLRRLDIDEVGGRVLDFILGRSAVETSSRIATRIGGELEQADGLLLATSAALLVRLASDGAAAEELTSDLVAEKESLVAGGWAPWLDENASPGPGSSAQPRNVDALRTVDAGHHGAAAVSAESRGGDRLVAGPADPFTDPVSDSTRTVAGRTNRPPDRRPHPTDLADRRGPAPATERGRPRSARKRRRVGVGTALLLTLLGMAGLLLFFGVRGLNDDDGDGSRTESASSDSTTGIGDLDSADDSSADGEDDTSPSAAPVGAETADAGTGVTAISVSLDDPLEVTTGTGTADLTLDSQTGEVCYDFDVEGIGSPYDGHIHIGPPGVKGSIIIDFGLLDGPTTGCIAGAPNDVDAILADLAGHYVEFHDVDGIATVRRQLADPGDGVVAAPDASSDRDGAIITIQTGAVVLQGNVPDQEAADKLVESFADIDFGTTELVNELTVVPGSPRPSGLITVDDGIFFDVDADTLTDPTGTVITDLATIFLARPAWTMTVIGHTDNTGPAVYNLELSLRRAAAVRDALVAAGVRAEALTIRGAGDTAPIADNDTAEGMARNRRIEFIVSAG